MEAYLWKVLGSSGSGKKDKQTSSLRCQNLGRCWGKVVGHNTSENYILALITRKWYQTILITQIKFYISNIFFIRFDTLLNHTIGQKNNKLNNRKKCTTNLIWWMVSTKIQNKIYSNFMKGTTYIILKTRIYSLPKIYNTIWRTYIFKNIASKSTVSMLLKWYHYIPFTQSMTVFQFVSILQARL